MSTEEEYVSSEPEIVNSCLCYFNGLVTAKHAGITHHDEIMLVLKCFFNQTQDYLHDSL